MLDTSIFVTFKNHYQAAADGYIDHFGPRSKIKLTAKQPQILCTRLISTAWIRTRQSVNFQDAFRDIGYTWVCQSPVSIRTLPGFVFDPSTVTSSSIYSDENEKKNEDNANIIIIIEDENNNRHLTSSINNNKFKQLNLDQFIKK